MDQILFKNYNGARLALNIAYWTADGGRDKVGGSPAALRAILDKYIKAGFMVHGDGWKEFTAVMDQAAARDGKGSQAAEKAAILAGYIPDGDAEPGYIFIKKSKMKEAEKMKEAGKVTYKKVNYMVVMMETATGKFHAEPVTGYTRDDIPGLAIRKHTGGTWAAAPWTVDNIEYGCSVVGTGSATRDAAAAAVLEVSEKINRVLADPARVADLMKRKKAAEMNCRVDEVPADPEPEKEPEPAAEVKVPEVKAAPVPEKIPAPVVTDAEKVRAAWDNIITWLHMDKHNGPAVLAAAMSAEKVTADEVLNYLQRGTLPPVHTFDAWKDQGRTVRKGEKAAFAAYIWKYTRDGKKDADAETETDAETIPAGPDFIRKKAYFFRIEQTETAAPVAGLETVPDGCKLETVNGCRWISGDTRKHKETLKAAGYRWSNKRGAWYRLR